jgi:hypothetical protein
LICIYVALAVLSFLCAISTTAYDQFSKRRECEQKLEEAINTSRPEVFVTLSFSPGRVGTRLIGLQNCGVRDARNIQVHPLRIMGINRGREETKELAFPHISYLPRSEDSEYPPVRLNNLIDREQGVDMAIYLRAWCDNWEKDTLEFDMPVQ